MIDKWGGLLQSLRNLSQSAVLVGIPSDDEQPHLGAGKIGTEKRTDTNQISNASIGYIMEHGSPAANIPARPHLIPGVESVQSKIIGYLHDAGAAALEGNTTKSDKNLHAAGLTAQNAVRQKIRSNIPPPLSPATIAARRRRTKGSSYRRKATTAGDVTALIDSGQYIAAISYVIRKKK